MSPTATMHRQAGFTLIEIVVALSMLAVILALATTGLQVLGRSAGLGARTIDRNEMLARGLDVVRVDLERIERVVKVVGEGAQFDFTGDAGRIETVVLEPPYPGDGGLFRLGYGVVREGGTTRLVRTRVPFRDDGVPSAPSGEADIVTVLEGTFETRFSFLERSGDQTRWVTRWVDARRLPALIRLELVGTVGGRALSPPVIVRPRVDAEVGCVSAKAGRCSARNGGALPDTEPSEEAEPTTRQSGRGAASEGPRDEAETR